MCDKIMQNYKPNMFQLQCLKALEAQIFEGKGYNEAEIGRKMQVNRSTISRCFKKYREEGFLKEKDFTKKGKEFLEYYKAIEKDLYQYFASIGINEAQQKQVVTGMFDTADIDTIQKLCQKEKMHLKYENIGKNDSKEITKITDQELKNYIKEGTYKVPFSIYRQGKDWRSLSMADNGFQKPAYLYFENDKKYLELTTKEMKAMTKGGALLSGHIQTVKCRNHKDVLYDLPIKDKKIQIPLEDIEFENLSEIEIMGQIQLFMTSSVGEKRMPESMATLVVKL